MRSVDSKKQVYSGARPGALRRDVSETSDILALDDVLVGNLSNGARFLDAGAVFAFGIWAFMQNQAGSALDPSQLLLVGFFTLAIGNLLHFGGFYGAKAFSRPARFLIGAPLVGFAAIVSVPLLLWAVGGVMYLGLSNAALWAGGAAAGMVVSRLGLMLLAEKLRRAETFTRRVALVGDPALTGEIRRILGRKSDGTRLVAEIADQPAEGEAGALDALPDILKASMVDDVIVALPWNDQPRMEACLQRLRELPVDVHLFPDNHSPFLASQGVSVLGKVAMVRLGARPLSPFARFVKGAEDRIIGGFVLILAAPIMAVVAIAIKLDSPGPVLFRQKRYGYNNEIFTCFKFRSMRVDAEKQPLRQATRNDPRITRVGGFLRRTSLDELPQILNVMNGTMSLVGPRPHAVEHQTYYQQLVDEYRCRHRMKPGITGWAQIHGFRGETQTLELMRQRVQYDLEYIENWSLALDLRILISTPFACMRGTNAY